MLGGELSLVCKMKSKYFNKKNMKKECYLTHSSSNYDQIFLPSHLCGLCS